MSEIFGQTSNDCRESNIFFYQGLSFNLRTQACSDILFDFADQCLFDQNPK